MPLLRHLSPGAGHVHSRRACCGSPVLAAVDVAFLWVVGVPLPIAGACLRSSPTTSPTSFVIGWCRQRPSGGLENLLRTALPYGDRQPPQLISRREQGLDMPPGAMHVKVGL